MNQKYFLRRINKDQVVATQLQPTDHVSEITSSVISKVIGSESSSVPRSSI
jgi:hypothetical protein